MPQDSSPCTKFGRTPCLLVALKLLFGCVGVKLRGIGPSVNRGGPRVCAHSVSYTVVTVPPKSAIRFMAKLQRITRASRETTGAIKMNYESQEEYLWFVDQMRKALSLARA